MAWARGRRRAGVVMGLALSVVGVFAAGPAGAAQPPGKPPGQPQRPGQLYVLNAVLGSPADVLLDGHAVRAGLAPKALLGPLKVTAGKHVVALRGTSGVIAQARLTVGAGASLDVVAHRRADASMSPVMTVFPNARGPVVRGKARLVVSHVAVAPPADIRVNGDALFRNVANGESLSLVVPAKTYSVDIVPTATTGPKILAPVRLKVRAGTLTRVLAVGDPADKSADAVVQVIPVRVVGSAAPRLVRTGDGGQAAVSYVGHGTPGWAVGAALAVGGLLLFGTSRSWSAGRSRCGGRHNR